VWRDLFVSSSPARVPLVARGVARQAIFATTGIGVTSEAPRRRRCATRMGLPRIRVMTTHYHLLVRTPNPDLALACSA
jgi:hypothetical protein